MCFMKTFKTWTVFTFYFLLSTFAGLAQTLVDPTLTRETVISSDLSLPIVLEFLRPDDPNQFFVGEKNSGRVKLVVNGSVTATVLDLPVNFDSERGLLGMILDPDFEHNGYVYLYYTLSSSGGDTNIRDNWVDNRVERYRWNGTALVEPLLIVSFPKDLTQANGPNHDGGVILFGPDGKLYGVTGDLNRGRFSNPRIEQNTGTNGVAGVGGIFRLNPDGTIPSDNPFISHTAPAIRRLYAYGIRNSFGLTIDSLTGKLWMTENGPNVYDEINLVERGFNSGWLKIMGPDSRNATYSENGFTVFNANDLVYLPGAHYADPKFSWLTPLGVAAMAFLRSARFDPGTRDQLVVGETNNSNLYLFPMNGTRDGFLLSGGLTDLVADSSVERDLVRWGSGWGIVTDLKIGPDGYLYVVSLFANRIHRIRPINPPTIIHGQVQLADWSGARLGIPFTLQLKVGNTVTETFNITLDAYGRYSVRVANPGSYTVVAKASHWLAVRQTGVNLSAGGFAYLRWNLAVNGDANGDNRVDDLDLGQVLRDFGSGSVSSDMSGDGTVGNEDLSLVLEPFGAQGET